VTFDVAVVGAGPAGATAALTAARSGASVILLDRAAFPRRKVCGGCVGSAAMRLLQEVGVADAVRDAGARRLETMELRAGRRRARLRLRDGAVAISRAALDHVLVEAAAGAEVELRLGRRVMACRVDGSRARTASVGLDVRDDGGAEEIRARVVVDATGLGPLPSAEHPVDEAVAPSSRIGVSAVYPADSAGGLPNGLRMVVGRRGYVGMVVLEDGRLNVAAAVDPSALVDQGPAGAVSEILAEAGGRLPDAEPALGWRGTPALTRRTRSVAETRIFRVGDAAGYVEPFTGEGIGWAVGCGVAVSAAVEVALVGEVDHAAKRWIGDHQRLVADRQRLCRLLARGLRRPGLVRAVVALLGLAPRLADPLFGMTARPAGWVGPWRRSASEVSGGSGRSLASGLDPEPSASQ